MDTLSVWIFDAPEGAEEALRRIERRQLGGELAVADAAVVAWPIGAARPRTYQSGAVDGSTALSGAFWGLMFGAVFLLPVAATEKREPQVNLGELGLSSELVARLRHRVVAGRSALFLVTASATVESIGLALDADAPERWTVDVAPDRQAGMWRAFASDDIPLP